jgi:hypothetical protein
MVTIGTTSAQDDERAYFSIVRQNRKLRWLRVVHFTHLR